jgi:hypothetical protein
MLFTSEFYTLWSPVDKFSKDCIYKNKCQSIYKAEEGKELAISQQLNGDMYNVHTSHLV